MHHLKDVLKFTQGGAWVETQGEEGRGLLEFDAMLGEVGEWYFWVAGSM